MDFSPTSAQVLFLWRLLVEGGHAFAKDLKPQLKKKKDKHEKKELFAQGLLEKKAPPGKKTRAEFVNLTDKGWEWVGHHLDAEIGSRSTAAGPILHAIMSRLQAHLQARGISLAEFMASGRTSPASEAPRQGTPLPEGDGSPQQHLRQAYLTLSQGRLGVRVRLAALRTLLPNWPRQHLDRVLTQMEGQGQLVLYRLEDPLEIHPADEQAALNNSVGDPRHIVYMEV